VVTALTAQNTRGVTAIHDAPADFVSQQIDAVLSDLKVDAVKIGMLSRPATIAAVAKGLAAFKGPVVLDPVMVAASGDRLLVPEAVAALKQELIPLASLITPNLPEAAALLEEPLAADEEAMTAQGRKLVRQGAKAVLVKGGHGTGEDSVDILVTAEKVRRYAARRVATQNTHGTGCTLSSAIAAFLARGLRLESAIAEAKDYLTGAIAAADRLKVGHGHGPVHHFHRWWPS
jgi:hydroxymethylpyrimidine/phosphomethylpyrimidine kinase